MTEVTVQSGFRRTCCGVHGTYSTGKVLEVRRGRARIRAKIAHTTLYIASQQKLPVAPPGRICAEPRPLSHQWRDQSRHLERESPVYLYHDAKPTHSLVSIVCCPSSQVAGHPFAPGLTILSPD